MGQTQPAPADQYPDLWGLTVNEVTNRKSTALLSVQEYHINQSPDPESEVRNIESVAFYPLHLLLNNFSPFNYSVDTDNATPKTYIPIFQNSIILYQLFIFYVFTISEIGSVHADKILDLQSEHLDTWLGTRQGGALSARFDDISNAAKEHAQNLVSVYEYVDLDIPIENTIAKTFLLNNRESPLYVNPDKRSNASEINFRGLDLALAEHLGQSKDQALQVYASYFSSVIVEV